jgi:hypothetical protein
MPEPAEAVVPVVRSGGLNEAARRRKAQWAATYGPAWNLPVTLAKFLGGKARYTNVVAEAGELLRALPDKSVGMVFGSPPYEGQRTYEEADGTRPSHLPTGEDWVAWMVSIYEEAVRACTGVVGFVVQGSAEDGGGWSAVPVLLMADLKRRGHNVWCPPLYKRFSAPGSGGKQKWRIDYEFVVCVSPATLPFADPTACGGAPKYGVGGAMSNRTRSGVRVSNGRGYKMPKRTNPGNVIAGSSFIDVGAVGGGNMGGNLAHTNEAPFHLDVPTRFVASFLAEDDVLVDPFCGSGTSQAAALQEGRRAIGGDTRKSQVHTSDIRCEAYA